ncbi:beta-ketoacyl synthase chain length factor [Colwellia sp. E2M01]|uniref:beta-ketoacyl synthase chain length factor n=1 Tax=Colwellia sp. E2M01 TaxID=2841561 RepID=UPI001C097FAE|nr:beta-ketoacyl synthase chain length factor [Colwellia sp. E2M01]MBU2871612.1 beta-ketoacyl synthase chain length factor [Colwellia sp. E2M01]
MEFHIEKLSAWCGNLHTSQQWQQWALGEITYQDEDELPALKQIPAMQRRRLSRFAKLTMQCVLDVTTEASIDESNHIPCVFSSRHGDLHKTSKLIEDVAQKQDLSPTHFGLSVHNAVAGLYSIFSKNKQPMTATSAGEDTFLMALVDGYAKLESQKLDRILVVYTDEIVPEKYTPYVPDTEKTISVALILTRQKSHHNVTINFTSQQNKNIETEFQALSFLSFLYGKEQHINVNSTRYQWKLTKL